MRFTLPVNAFPALELAADEQALLIDEANRVLDETIRVNEAFLASGRQFPRDEWKPVRAKEGVSVYKQRVAAALRQPKRKERATSNDSSASHANSQSSASSSERNGAADTVAAATSYVEWLKRPQVPLLALSGLLDGTLEDAMYGCFADTDETWRWRSTHVNERFDDAKILTKVLGPTPAEPFRYLGVKWFIKEHPAALNQFIKRRDFLILEATGITEDSQGKPVGYLLMHSMAIPRIPELRELGVVRANLSFCFLIRPHTENTVDIYCRGFTDPQGDMIETVSVLIAAESLIAAVSVVDYAYVKKLKWLMLKRQQQQQRRGSHAIAKSSGTHCESCKRALSKFGLLSSSGSACNLCWKVICGRCSVAKKVTMDIIDNVAIQKVLNFCLGCVLEAKEVSALELAKASIPPPPTSDEFRTPHATPTPKRSGSRSRQLSQPRLERSASSQSTASSTSSRVSERHPQQLPVTPGRPARRAPPPPPPVLHAQKVTISRSTEATAVRS